MATIIKTVNKKELQGLNYLKSDVLFNNMEKEKRKILLEKAYRMSNGVNANKARIVFACSDGIKKIETRIISLNKTSVILKGVSSLPIKSIIGVTVIQD
jgi:ribosomal protein S17